ncbi:MAG: hypothetical protein H7Y06_05615 [Opitutaceae bacterium]|nr:hypothetical protein [Opitutaceae bacterium]
MKKFLLPVVGLMLAVMLAGGCATPDARIKRSPEIFARLSPEQQNLVKGGKVGIGFDKDAVMLAVGLPDRKWTRTDAAGSSEVWSYVAWETLAGQPLYRGWYHGYTASSSAYYMNYPGRREREYFKVVFGADAKVVAIEQASN